MMPTNDAERPVPPAPEVALWTRRARHVNSLTLALLPAVFVPLFVNALADNALNGWWYVPVLRVHWILSVASVALWAEGARAICRAPYDSPLLALFPAPDDPCAVNESGWLCLWSFAALFAGMLAVTLPVTTAALTLKPEVPLPWRLACLVMSVTAACVVGLYVLAVYRLARAAGPATRAAHTANQ